MFLKRLFARQDPNADGNRRSSVLESALARRGRREILLVILRELHYQGLVTDTVTTSGKDSSFHWLRTGEEALADMLSAIRAARASVRLETYIYENCALGLAFRDALSEAAARRVRVQVLIDAVGSIALTDSFWQPLRAAGGEMRWFNPITLGRISHRDHRKMLVVDDETAFVGGCNIAEAQVGDGRKSGWRDLGLRIEGPLAAQLADGFDQMFERAGLKHRRFQRLRRPTGESQSARNNWQLLLSGPGRGRRELKRHLARDLARARDIQIISAYFLPTWRLRRELRRVSGRGGRVQLILAGKTDIVLAQYACRHLYGSLLRAGVEIYEYQPQILHSKLVIADDVVYAGSANLDSRSLNINYELLVRVASSPLAVQAREIFAADLKDSRHIRFEEWRRSRTIWRNTIEYLAAVILARFDPYLARWQARYFARKKAPGK